jgi:glycosyltransferase involved in cell wall biosynthesis
MGKDKGHPDHPTYPRGVSVIVCCHNAACRLAPTLQHLAAQQASEDLSWEVLVVDNASTDGTAELACSIWPADHRIPLRVIPESRLGLSNARATGLAEARYEYISFVDDDNWVCPRWIETVVQVLDQDSQAGACMGAVEAVFETEAPPWFERYQQNFAVGNWGPTPKYMVFMDIWGAGLSLRHTAWKELCSAGFAASLSGRRGTRVTSGEDTEICAALTLLGWKLRYDPRLKLQHFMPSGRLNWSYVRRFWRGYGHAGVALDWYRFALEGKPATWKVRVVRGWAWNLFWAIRALARSRRALVHGKVGDHDQLDAEAALGRAQALLTGFLGYRRGRRRVQRLFWPEPNQPTSSSGRAQADAFGQLSQLDQAGDEQ